MLLVRNESHIFRIKSLLLFIFFVKKRQQRYVHLDI